MEHIALCVAQLVLGVLASIIGRWCSRRRAFPADIRGVELAGRGRMIAALERFLRRVAQPRPLDQLAALAKSSGAGEGVQRLFMSHPPLEERIAPLRNAYCWGRSPPPH